MANIFHWFVFWFRCFSWIGVYSLFSNSILFIPSLYPRSNWYHGLEHLPPSLYLFFKYVYWFWGWERQKNGVLEKNINWLPPSHVLTGDKTHYLGMWHDLESKLSVHGMMLQPTEPHQPEHLLCIYFWSLESSLSHPWEFINHYSSCGFPCLWNFELVFHLLLYVFRYFSIFSSCTWNFHYN